MMAEKQLKVVVGAKTSDFEKAMKKVEKSMMKVGKTLTSVGKGMTKTITAPILAVTGTAIKAFADFEKAMTSSTAIMGNLSDEMRSEMERTARDLRRTDSPTGRARGVFHPLNIEDWILDIGYGDFLRAGVDAKKGPRLPAARRDYNCD